MGLNVTVQVGHYGYQNGVSDVWQSGPNSAGGVSVKGAFSFDGTKQIKYISIRFIPYNRVGDAVGCTTKGVSEYGLRCTGPYNANTRCSFFGENMWYNNGITSVRVTGASIEYMDGSTEELSGSDIGSAVVAPAGGCYVATAVYGSYDCPQVWTLRRYRDNDLAETWYGRAFIHTYYAISPTLVKWFGHTEWFKKMWRGKLDRMVKNLQDKGYESTPYEDRDWK